MPQLPMKEAAAALGISVDTVRRRLKSGDLQGTQEPIGSGAFRWMIEVPEGATATGSSADAQPASDATAPAQGLAVAEARIDGLESLVEELRSERDAWRDQAAADRDAARELRILLRGAQEVALPAEIQDAQHSPTQRDQDHHQGESTTAAPEGFWSRLRWLFGGGDA